MKSLLLLALVTSTCYGSTYEVTSRVIGYTCPSGYTYRGESGLCYLDGVNEFHSPGIDLGDETGVPKTVRRRKMLDKKALFDLLEGEYFKEEPRHRDSKQMPDLGD